MHAKAIHQNPKERLERAESYLKVDPFNPELLGLVIELNLESHDLDTASNHVATARLQHPANPALQYRCAQVLAACGKWEEAAPVFAGLLAAHPQLNMALSLAECQLHMGQNAAALETLRDHRDNPRLPPVAVTLMLRALHRLRQYAPAMALVALNLERLRDDSSFCAAASLLYLDAGNGERATALADLAFADGNRPVEALVTSATIALRGPAPERATEQFEEALILSPVDGRIWSGLGMASMLRGDKDRAKFQLGKAVQIMPSHLASWQALGWCHISAGDLNSARQAFSAALALDRNVAESHGAMAVVAALEGDEPSANAAIRVALRLDTTCLAAHYAQMVLNGEAVDTEKFRSDAVDLIAARGTSHGEHVAMLVERLVKR